MYVAGDEQEIEVQSNAMIRQWEAVQSLVPGSRVSVIVQQDDVDEDPNYRYDIQYIPGPTASLKPDTRAVPEEEIRKFDPNFRYQERDSSNPVTLKQFIKWGVQAYPAKHYALFILGHSWGQQGALQDFYRDGKKLESSSMIRNYEMRRLMEEVYRETRVGKFDLLVTDVCIQGQLDVALEYKDLFRYFVGTPIESPLNSFPYTEILDPFISAVDRSEKDALERVLLRGLVEKYVRSHSRGGSLVASERSLDPVEVFALRMDRLSTVANALRDLMRDLPESFLEGWRKGRLRNLDRLKDMDSNADLLLVARAFKGYATKWPELEKNASRLKESLGERPKDPSATPTMIEHETAEGAWVRIQVDEFLDSAELAACVALKGAILMNRYKGNFLPTMLDKNGKKVDWYGYDCYAEAKRQTPENSESVTSLFGNKLNWPFGVPARINQSNGTRTLSLWFKKVGKKLKYRPFLRLAGSTHISVDYGDTTQEENFPDAVYYLNNNSGLYVAEAHSHGTLFKQGLSIFLRRHIFGKVKDSNFGGRLPIEEVESFPYELTLEDYMERLREKGELDLQKIRGPEFYRRHRITSTYWPDFLFGGSFR